MEKNHYSIFGVIMSEDPFKLIVLRVFIAVIVSTLIVVIFKPFLSISVENMVCSNCGQATSLFLIALMVFGSLIIIMYKLMKVFYGD